MSKDTSQSADNLNSQILKLINQYDKLKKKNKDLSEEINALKAECDRLKQESLDYKTKYERIKLAKAFGLSEESKKQAHRKISKLVRDIDSCITILKK